MHGQAGHASCAHLVVQSAALVLTHGGATPPCKADDGVSHLHETSLSCLPLCKASWCVYQCTNRARIVPMQAKFQSASLQITQPSGRALKLQLPRPGAQMAQCQWVTASRVLVARTLHVAAVDARQPLLPHLHPAVQTPGIRLPRSTCHPMFPLIPPHQPPRRVPRNLAKHQSHTLPGHLQHALPPHQSPTPPRLSCSPQAMRRTTRRTRLASEERQQQPAALLCRQLLRLQPQPHRCVWPETCWCLVMLGCSFHIATRPVLHQMLLTITGGGSICAGRSAAEQGTGAGGLQAC